MLSSLHYEPPIKRSAPPPPRDFALLEVASSLAEEGRFVESVSRVYEHLFPAHPIARLDLEPFAFVQGSSWIHSCIEGDELVVTVRVARLPSGPTTVAALRHVLARMAGTGQLFQPRLRGEELTLEFRERLDRLHPAKLLEVLRKMPVMADQSDDWLVGEFQAQPLERAPVEPLTDEERARCERFWRSHWSDVEELGKESMRKRSLVFLNELTAFAVHRVQCTLPLCGILGVRLSQRAAIFNDGQEPPLIRERSLAKCAKEMGEVTPASLAQSLGHASYALSPLAEGSPDALNDQLGDGETMETVAGLRRSGKALDATLTLVSTYTYLLARFAWPAPVAQALQAGLQLASDKPWRDAANALVGHAQALVEAFGDEAFGTEEEGGGAAGEAVRSAAGEGAV